MKYAIYDKAADGYLTKMEFKVGYSEHTQFECGYNEYITEAKLLDTPKEAADAIVRIESFKFVDKGRFVVHSFDDTLKDQYIISEAGNPTKVVDNITVDIDGNINVKYGTMAFHWSTAFLEYAINRMNALQKAKSPKYTAWCNTFDIYKVIPVIDERSCGHYQFIKVTDKGLEKYVNDEEKHLIVGKELTDVTDPLNKRIEELEKANYELGETSAARGITANRLQEENDSLKNKVESIKNEARGWKELYITADEDRDELINAIDVIYNDLRSATTCNDLKDSLKALDKNSGLDRISMPTNVGCILDKGEPLTAKDEIYCIIDLMIKRIESNFTNVKELSDAADALKEVNDKNERLMNMLKEITDYIGDIMFATKTNDHDKMISDLTDISLKMGVKTIDDGPIYGIYIILNMLIRFAKKNVIYKHTVNSVYGMTIPGRCCGKQMTADVITGKKILVDKEKYDDLKECVNNISLTYEMMKITPFSMDCPAWLSGVINRIENLTK